MRNLRLAVPVILGLCYLWGSPSTDYWQQNFHYTMQVRLDPDQDHQITAHSTIVYYNESPDTLDRIYMHLYPEAFKKGSVKYREFSHQMGRLGRARGFMKDISPYEWDLKIDQFEVTNSDQTQSNDYSIDDTILLTKLPEKLAPGDSVTLNIDWKLKVGTMFERSGKMGTQYNMAQWYPKLVVYDHHGWEPNVFHAEGEFYGEYGDFDVTLDVPNNYTVGATGIVVDGDPGWDSVSVDTAQNFGDWMDSFKFPTADSTRRRVARFTAHKVHDFAWAASPDFVYESGSWNGIAIHVLYDKSDMDWNKVVVTRAAEALRWLSTQFGMYPYPQMTVIDRRRGGGMEYPMLVMNGGSSEGLIVHEIGHNWFYGILGNNETDQAWLDEGFTSFQTRWHALTEYPDGLDPNRPWLDPFRKKHWHYTGYYDRDQWRCIRAELSGFDEPVQRKSYLYKGGSNYGVNVYTKASIMMHELKAILGDSLFTSAMQYYYRTWELKHVDEYRFRMAMEKASGQQLDWFFDAWLNDTRFTDLKLKHLKTESNPEGGYQNTIIVKQLGDRFVPPVVDLVFKDGSHQRVKSDDFLWRFSDTLKAVSKEKPISAIVDPDNDYLDIDRRNNYSGRFPSVFMFQWPGMYYQPRDARVISWQPQLYYQDKDGWMPGLKLERDYGPWESTTLKLVVSPKTSRVYYDLNGWRKPKHKPAGQRWLIFHAFDFGGADGIKLQVNRQMSPGYGMQPTLTVRNGIYSVNAKDTSRTDLFDVGRSTVLYSHWTLDAGNHTISWEVNTAPSGWSDWSFARTTLTATGERDLGRFHWKNRIFAGKMWSPDTLPGQELFGLGGNSSYDFYDHSFTRDASSFYGVSNLRNHYHIGSDGNLRGFTQDYSGTESILAWNTSMDRDVNVPHINLTASAFSDWGLVNGFKLTSGDQGFNNDLIGDLGFGLELSKFMFGSHYYLRVDFPFMTYGQSSGSKTDFNNWVFSFQSAF